MALALGFHIRAILVTTQALLETYAALTHAKVNFQLPTIKLQRINFLTAVEQSCVSSGSLELTPKEAQNSKTDKVICFRNS